MIQEERNTMLVALAPYIPHKVMVEYDYGDGVKRSTEFHGNYYYLFMAYDGLDIPYNTRVLRASSIEGPYYDITGAEYPSAVPYSECFYYYNAYKAYFRYVLNTRAEMADTAIWQALQSDERVQAMPAYPAQGCLKDVDGVLVVKLGEPIDWSAKQ